VEKRITERVDLQLPMMVAGTIPQIRLGKDICCFPPVNCYSKQMIKATRNSMECDKCFESSP